MEKSELLSRRGTFLVGRHLVEQSPEEVAKALSGMVIVRCESRWDTATFEYTAVSPKFDVVPQGQITPQYDLLCHRTDDGATFEFVRRAA